jgi:DNA-binding CsgD family transcriptional regulator
MFANGIDGPLCSYLCCATIEASGICVMESENWHPNHIFPQIMGLMVVVRTPEDVKILSHPPWWTAGRLFAIIGALLGLLFGIFFWNRMLNRIAERRGREPADDAVLISTIRSVADGKTVISPEIKRLLAEDPPIPVLTSRQTEVLQSMMRGLTNHDIAKQLGIRQDGVNEHVAAILTKIGAANRTEAVAIALRKHLLKL